MQHKLKIYLNLKLLEALIALSHLFTQSQVTVVKMSELYWKIYSSWLMFCNYFFIYILAIIR